MEGVVSQITSFKALKLATIIAGESTGSKISMRVMAKQMPYHEGISTIEPENLTESCSLA